MFGVKGEAGAFLAGMALAGLAAPYILKALDLLTRSLSTLLLVLGIALLGGSLAICARFVWRKTEFWRFKGAMKK